MHLTKDWISESIIKPRDSLRKQLKRIESNNTREIDGSLNSNIYIIVPEDENKENGRKKIKYQ